MQTRKQKMRTRILSRLLPAVIISLSLLSLIYYSSMRESLVKNYEASKAATESHITDAVTLIDAGYRLLEVRLEAELKEQLDALTAEYARAGGEIPRMDLMGLKQQTGGMCDFIVIDEATTIIAASEPLALNFNFTAFDAALGKKIGEIRQGKEVWYEQVRTNVATGRLSKFAYVASPDHRYLLEVGYSVDGFDKLSEEMKPQSITDALVKISPLVESVRMFDAYGYGIVDSGENYKPTVESLAIVERAKKEKSFEVADPSGIVKKYLYLDLNSKRVRTLANTDRVIEVTYNLKPINAELQRLALISILINIVFVGALTLGIVYYARRLTRPLESLRTLSDEIAKGNYKVMADVRTGDEVEELADSFNTMIGDINLSFNQIDQQRQALEDYSRTLEERVASRTMEIAQRNQELVEKNNELEEAWAKANEATEAKSSFLAMISHEIRTPINGIVGMSYLLQRTKLSPRQRDYLSKIRGSADTLLEIINDVLDISKLEAGKAVLEQIRFSLEDVFEQVAGQVIYKASEKGLELVLRQDPEIPGTLLGDPLRLKQVLGNLLNNAVKFTEAGEILLTVSPLMVAPDLIRLQFSIQDTGIGIPPEKLEKLFQPFQQADDSITRKYGGTGLGLSICRHFVSMMNGDIWVESAPGKGSTFHFTAEFGLGEPLQSEGALAEAVRRLRVLVVDDSDTARLVLKEMLEEHVTEVCTAESGEEALTLLEDHSRAGRSFDLVLMDWKLKGIDGIETAYRIKQIENMQRLPSVLMLTGYDLDTARRNDKSENIDAFLSKPVMKNALLQVIADITGAGAPSASERGVDRIAALKVTDGSQRIRILLAEDNPINQQILQELLAHPQITLEVAENGRDAVEMAKENTYDLILMDIQMPVMDGLEATRHIRALEPGGQVPIVAMTAHALEEDRQKCLDAGMNDYMNKPIHDAELYTMAVRYIGKSLELDLLTEGYLADDSFLSGLRSFQTREILSSLKGDRALYAKLLTEFHEGFRDADGRLEAMLHRGDPEGIRRLVHSLRGIAGNLGAMELFIIAQTLESDLLKGSISADNENLVAFRQVLRRVMSEVGHVLSEIHAEPVAEALLTGTQGMAAVLSELKRLLRDGSSEAVRMIGAVRQLMGQTEQAALAELLIRQIETYDFDEALETVETIEKATDLTS